MTEKQSYLYSSPEGVIKLIEGDKMPVHEEYGCNGKPYCCPGERCRYLVYEEEYNTALQAAKASAIPIHNEIVAVSLIAHGQTILDLEKAKAHYCKPDTIYGPFSVGYRIEDACAHDSCPVDAMCEQCKEPVKIAILYDDTPEKEEIPKAFDYLNFMKEQYPDDDPVFSVMEIARMESIPSVKRYELIKEKFTITRK